MAILEGIEVTIEVDGQPLQEYDEIDEGGHPNDSLPLLMSKYVEATSGARFAIRAVVPKSFKALSDALSFKYYLDGSHVEDELMTMRPSELKRNIWEEVTEGSSKESKTGCVLRPFIFNEIQCSKYYIPIVATRLRFVTATIYPRDSMTSALSRILGLL